ncbi:hypothetical protein R1flu_018121 [Riccia fluitans]|uniref:Uncharacterized protein n=1 Tax=Riccia fluitans TaxID=41844 RepID=A0ABD1ZEY1_9MARC
MGTVQKEASKKRKASIQTVSDSDTETKSEDQKEPPKEVSRVFCEGEASGSKPLDLKVDFFELPVWRVSAVKPIDFLRRFMWSLEV